MSEGIANAMAQGRVRRSVEVDRGNIFTTLGSVTAWYRAGHFTSDEEARGAFKLAYQQALDGMGESMAEWMGMTAEEFSAWRHSETLPRE